MRGSTWRNSLAGVALLPISHLASCDEPLLGSTVAGAKLFTNGWVHVSNYKSLGICVTTVSPDIGFP